MYKNVGLQVLQAKIRGFEAAGKTLMQHARKTSGDKRHALRLAKRRLACVARLHLIAYALLRGVPYEQVERCGDHNKPYAQGIADIVKLHNVWSEDRGFYAIELDKVKLWLTGETLKWDTGRPFGLSKRRADEWRAAHASPRTAHERTA